jgi:hypothetical protein
MQHVVSTLDLCSFFDTNVVADLKATMCWPLVGDWRRGNSQTSALVSCALFHEDLHLSYTEAVMRPGP